MTPGDWLDKVSREISINSADRKRAKEVVKIFKRKDKKRRHNILWSNVKTLESATFSATPKPVAQRRFLDKGDTPEQQMMLKIARQAGLVIERALMFSNETDKVKGKIKMALRDRYTAGWGFVRVVFDPKFDPEPSVTTVNVPQEEVFEGKATVEGKEVEVQSDEMGYFAQVPDEPELLDADVTTEVIPFKDAHWEPGKNAWEDVGWVAFDRYLTREQLKEQFGRLGEKVELTHKEGEEQKDGSEAHLGHVIEIYDKTKREYLVVSRGVGEFLKKESDPWNLEGFYPFPKPLFATLTSDKLFPVPDYDFYESLAEQLERIAVRIEKITHALKVRGGYEKQLGDSFTSIFDADDNEFKPLDALSLNGQSLDKFIWFAPLDVLRQVLNDLYVAQENAKQEIYEITGISDIVRGQGEASETATAQRVKSQFANLRLKELQDEVAEFSRDLYRIKAEMIVEQIPPEILSQMTGIDITPEIYQLLTDDKLRSFKIDIETDSTLASDEVQEQQNRIEFMNQFSAAMAQLIPLTMSGVNPEVVKHLAMFVVRGFPQARELEDLIDEQLFTPMEADPMTGVPAMVA